MNRSIARSAFAGLALVLAGSITAAVSGAPQNDCASSLGITVTGSIAWHELRQVVDYSKPPTQMTPESPPQPQYMWADGTGYSYTIRCLSTTGSPARYHAVIEYAEDDAANQPASLDFRCPSSGATVVAYGFQRDIGDFGRDLIGEAAANEAQGSLDVSRGGETSDPPDCRVLKPTAVARAAPSPLPVMSPTAQP